MGELTGVKKKRIWERGPEEADKGEGSRRSGYRGRGSRRSGHGEEGQEEADTGEGLRRS